ncbi:MAG: winged helix-turn-helix domain-containing protein [Armatimonadota bacterium]|jgi:DNA-binding response OmpR family regulator
MQGKTLLLMLSDEARDRTIEGLRERRIDVRIAECVEDVLAGTDWPDVAVIDLAAAARDGRDLCAALREAGLPGLIALGDPARRMDAADLLRAGADDFMPHPAGPAELVARVRALLRRLREYSLAPAGIIDLGEVTVLCDRHEVLVRGDSVELTPKEFDLLRELARGGGRLVARDALLQRVWGYDDSVSSRTLDVHVGRLRRKIERDPSNPRLIVTVPRVGYRMAA